MNWPENPPPPPSSNFSWETSSAVSKATTENLASGLEELEAQQAKMTDATTKLLSVVSEAGGGPWSDSPGLTEDLLSEWLGVQEDRGDGLRDTVIRKQEELARMEEAGEDNFLGPGGTGQSMGQTPLHFDPLAGPAKARTPEYRQAGTKINKPQGKVEEETETCPPAPWKPQHSRVCSGVERGEEGISHRRASQASSQC